MQRELFDRLAAAAGIPAEWSTLGLLIGLAPIAAGVLYHHFTHLDEIEGGEDVSYARITDGVGGPVIALRIWSFPARHPQVAREVRNAIDARW